MNLTVHNVYFCFSEVGCTISLRDGTPCKEVPAHTPTLFVAQQSDMVCSDPAAEVKEIPNGLQLLHGQMMKEQAPAWFAPLKAELTAMLDGSKFELAWLAGEKKLVVHTDRVDNDLLERVRATAEAYMPAGVELAQYNHNMEISWRDINKYAECVIYADMVAVNPDFANDLTSDGEWCYNLPKLKYLNRYHEGSGQWQTGFWQSNKRIKKWSVELPAVIQAGCVFSGSSIEIFDGGFPALVCPTYLYNAAQIESQGKRIFWDAKKLRYYRGDLSKTRRLDIAFDGCTSLTEFHAELNSLCIAVGAFSYCKLDKESALRILNSLPDKEYVDSVYTNPNGDRQKLTIGIHIDHQTDDDVLAAIANAEAKGWTLTVQWNGTPTASASVTYGLRKPPIYAKIGEHEMPDGTVERHLDWGHYVTDPTGYEEFRSVEAAREYFGLPDESLTNE